jgi:YD repeat-containing protein
MLEYGEGGCPLTDLSKWKIHGPVHSLRSETSEWDLGTEEWRPPRSLTLAQFLRNGSIGEIEHHNPDGSMSRSSYSYDGTGRLSEIRSRMNGGAFTRAVYFYDDLGRLIRILGVDQEGREREAEAYSYGEDGRKTRICILPKPETDILVLHGVEFTDQAYSAPGATTKVIGYDERGRPSEIRFEDAEQRLVMRVIFTWDNAGRLQREEAHVGEQSPFPDMEKVLESAPPEAREGLAATIANVLSPKAAISSTTYAYDETGRLLERRTRMLDLSEDRTTFSYDEHGNPTEEITEDSSREIQIDEGGSIRPVKETSSKHHVHLAYTYDARGNWVERVVWTRLEPNPNFQRSNVERREITYYD